jgi:hypothetical protein
VAIDILDQREIGDPFVVGDGVKHSKDAAYTLAMHLLAAQLNFGAGAETCDAARDAALAGEELLDKYDFNGEGDYLLSKNRKVRADYKRARELATDLDLYNNGDLCVGGPSVTITNPTEGEVLTTSAVTIEASVQDVADVNVVVDQVVDVPMHVASLGTGTQSANGGKWIATVTAEIKDGYGNAAVDATVFGVWSNGSI